MYSEHGHMVYGADGKWLPYDAQTESIEERTERAWAEQAFQNERQNNAKWVFY